MILGLGRSAIEGKGYPLQFSGLENSMDCTVYGSDHRVTKSRMRLSDSLSLLLRRKAMTNVDSMLKSRDITLPTKVHIVKAMVFSVIMYTCESWTIKKGES